MIEKDFKVLNDYFMRYLLAKEDSQNILKDLINSVRIDAGQEGFEEVKILNTFNLKESINGKETIVDVRAKTKSGEIVIIEIQLCGNMDFLKRIFYYISKNIVNELKEGEYYKQLSGIISINLLNFNLDFGDEGKPHRCFKLIDTKNHNVDLDFIQMHVIEAKRFIEIIEKSTIDELKKNKLLTWMKFFTTKNLKSTEKELNEANPIMTKVIEEYKRFTSDDKLMCAYDARDTFLVGQKIMLDREREEGIKEGMEKGIKKGIKRGIKEGKLEGIKDEKYSIAIAMKKDGAYINLISKYTGLPIEEIEKL